MSVSENERDQTAVAEPRESFRRSLHPLHEAAMRLAEYRPGRKRAKSKALVAMLLSHGARAWRHSQPLAEIHIHIASHRGRFPVVMRLR